MATDHPRFQILSLDGGGIKGLYSAAVLAKIEDDLRLTVANHFDLIVGTSTGGIIALGLGAGFRPREIVHFYVSQGPTIFRRKPWYKRLILDWENYRDEWQKYLAQGNESLDRRIRERVRLSWLHPAIRGAGQCCG